jgi:Mlo family
MPTAGRALLAEAAAAGGVAGAHGPSTSLSEWLLVVLIIVSLVLEVVLHRLERWIAQRHLHLQAVLRNLYRELMVLGLVSFVFIFYEAIAHPPETAVLSFEFAHVFIFLLALFHTGVVLASIAASLSLSRRWKHMEQMELLAYLDLKDEFARYRARIHASPFLLHRRLYWWFPRVQTLLRYWHLHEIMAFHDIRFQFLFYRALPEDFNFSAYLRKVKAVTFIDLVDAHWSLWLCFLVIVLIDVARRSVWEDPTFESAFVLAAAVSLIAAAALLNHKIRSVYWDLTRHPATYFDNVSQETVREEIRSGRDCRSVDKRALTSTKGADKTPSLLPPTSTTTSPPTDDDAGAAADDERTDAEATRMRVAANPSLMSLDTRASSADAADVAAYQKSPDYPHARGAVTNSESANPGISEDIITAVLQDRVESNGIGFESVDGDKELLAVRRVFEVPRRTTNLVNDPASLLAAAAAVMPLDAAAIAIAANTAASLHVPTAESAATMTGAADAATRGSTPVSSGTSTPGAASLTRASWQPRRKPRTRVPEPAAPTGDDLLEVAVLHSLGSNPNIESRRGSLDEYPSSRRASLEGRPPPSRPTTAGVTSSYSHRGSLDGRPAPALSRTATGAVYVVSATRQTPRSPEGSRRGSSLELVRSDALQSGRASLDSQGGCHRRSIELSRTLPMEELRNRNRTRFVGGAEIAIDVDDFAHDVDWTMGDDVSVRNGLARGRMDGRPRTLDVLNADLQRRYVNPSLVKHVQQTGQARDQRPPKQYPKVVKMLIPRLKRVAGTVEKLFWFGSHRFFLWCVEFTLFFATVLLASTSASFVLIVRRDSNSELENINIAAIAVSAIALMYVLVRIGYVMKKYTFVLNNAGLVPEVLALQVIHNVRQKRQLMNEMYADMHDDASASDSGSEACEAARERRRKFSRFFNKAAESGHIPGVSVDGSSAGEEKMLGIKMLRRRRKRAPRLEIPQLPVDERKSADMREDINE